MTPGQQLALAQLRRLVASSAAVELISAREPTEDEQRLVLEVSLYTGDMPTTLEGIPLRARERVLIWIRPDFPYEYPRVSVEHRRFDGFPHVQWGTDLCLYQAPQSEWSPRLGILGFLERLELWLRKAAINELDPVGGALHPPVAYPSNVTTPIVLIRADTAKTTGDSWLGFADIKTQSDYRVDVTAWRELGEPTTDLTGPAILLDREMPFEYPTTVERLLVCLEKRLLRRICGSTKSSTGPRIAVFRCASRLSCPS